MIYAETKLSVGDNSGAKVLKCIKVFRNSKSSGAKPLSLIVGSVRKIRSNKKIIKGQISKGLLVRGKKNIQRNTGLSIKFIDNSVVLVDLKGLPIGSRLIGPMYKELRSKNYPKVFALAKTLI